jgi:sugar O-acyltransferase (sialic acid O-acetyltransferase NeuD family)
MKRLLIVGAGGFGRELFNFARQHPDHGREWTVGGFLDDRADALAKFRYNPGVVGSIGGYQPAPGDLLLCGLGLSKVRKDVVTKLLARGAEFLTFIHPRAVLGDHVVIGRGSVICPGVVVTSDITLGEFVVLNNNATVGHDSALGDYVSLSCHADVTGFCTLGEGVFMGSHACMIPGSKIGAWALLGAGATVMTPVESGVTVIGNPARRINP